MSDVSPVVWRVTDAPIDEYWRVGMLYRLHEGEWQSYGEMFHRWVGAPWVSLAAMARDGYRLIEHAEAGER